MVKIRKVPQTGLRVEAAMESPQRVLIRSCDRPQSVQTMRLDMPEILGGTNKGLMPLEALIGAYAGSLNVVGNFVAKTMDFDLRDWNFTVWAEFDPRGIYGLAKVPKALRVLHVDARVTTPESPKRLAQLRKTTTERCPVHNLLKGAGVRLKENWAIVAPNGSATAAAKPTAKSKSKK
ncbi:MAG: OsmC family protein [Acidobacteria bacterium]|nr:OsmC family protein [Acidobacteriota bacterium]